MTKGFGRYLMIRLSRQNRQYSEATISISDIYYIRHFCFRHFYQIFLRITILDDSPYGNDRSVTNIADLDSGLG